MQAIYINGIQIHSNSQDLGYVVNYPIAGLEFPDIRITQYDKPGEHGAIVQNQFYGGRHITFTGRIGGRTPAQYLLNKRTLQNALRILQNSINIAQPVLLTFTTVDNLRLQAHCYADKAPQITDKSLEYGTFIISLYAPDNNLYDQSVQTISLTPPTGGGVTYPVIYPVTYAAKTGGSTIITNAGDSDSFPIITLQGPLTSPYINNVTTGAVFQVNRTLVATDTITIDMKKKTMLLNGNNALQYFNITNTWISLTPGDNIITLGTGLSSDNGNMKVSFQNSYIGV